jgi:DNA-binding NarL/FixJ family response regulator
LVAPTGCCEFLDFLRAEIVRACGSDSCADAIIREVQANYGTERPYIAAMPDDRRQEALRMLRNGMAPEMVARKLSVHQATVYRWRKAGTLRRRTGLGGDEWVL